MLSDYLRHHPIRSVAYLRLRTFPTVLILAQATSMSPKHQVNVILLNSSVMERLVFL